MPELPDWAKSTKLGSFFNVLLKEFVTCDLATFWATYKIEGSIFCCVMVRFSRNNLTKSLLL